MKILVVTVGTGRNREDIASAIAFSARHHRADRLVCCCSTKTAAETYPLVRDALASKLQPDTPAVCTDEEDVQGLFVEYTGLLDGLRREDPEAEIIVDFTSGTKPMSAAMFAAAVSRRVGQVSYVTGPKDATGRATESTAVKHLEPSLVTADEDLRLAVRLFNEYEFAAARAIADRYRKALPEGTLRTLAASLYWVGEAYHRWELFDWKKAAQAMKKALDSRGGSDPPLRDRLDAQRMFLEETQPQWQGTPSVDQARWRPHRLADLCANVGRRIEQGRFDDAVARCYRAFEYLAQWRLATVHGVDDTGKVSVTTIPATLQSEWRIGPGTVSLKLGLAQAYQLLEALGDDLGRTFRDQYIGQGKWLQPKGPLSAGLQARNQSLLAHGYNPVPEPTARDLYTALLALVKDHVPNISPLLTTAEFIRWPERG